MKDEIHFYNKWRHLNACDNQSECSKECYSLDLNGGRCLCVERCTTCHRFCTTVVDCKHEIKEVRLKTYSNGGTGAYEQCMSCGDTFGTAIKQTPDLLVDGPLKPAIDRQFMNYDLKEKAKEKLHKNRSKQMSADAQREHEAYTNSDTWKQLRQKVLERDKFLCQACLSKTATEVHHMTYRNLGEEFAWQLYSVCRDCHERYHQDEECTDDRR